MPFWYRVFPNILQRTIWVLTRLALFFFVRLQIKGLEHMDTLPHGVIFALNHSSELDAVILPASFPFWSRFFPMFYTSRPKNKYQQSRWRQHFYGGLLFMLWGAYPIKTNQHNYEIALKLHIEILQKENSLCVFPEGGVSPDSTLRKGRGGVSYLSFRTGKPIVPVAIKGSWGMGLIDFLLRRRNVIINFGKPIFPNELFAHCQGKPVVNELKNDFTTASALVMSKIKALLD